MSRLDTETRLKQLRAALVRVAKGRPRDARNGVLTISSVAREAGVSASLLHNSYPDLVDEIRRRSAKRKKEVDADLQSTTRMELQRARVDLAKLASINEMLLIEIEILREQLKSGKRAPVVSISERIKNR